MTMSPEAPTHIPARPDGMGDEQWTQIEAGFRSTDHITQRLAQRCLNQFNTAVELTNQRTAQNDSHREALEYQQAQITKLQRQMAVIAERLLEEARRREWCGEYDEFAAEVNRVLGEDVLLPCRRNYDVTFTLSIVAEARHEDSAAEWAAAEVDRLLGRGSFIAFNATCEGTEEADT